MFIKLFKNNKQNTYLVMQPTATSPHRHRMLDMVAINYFVRKISPTTQSKCYDLFYLILPRHEFRKTHFSGT